MLFLYQESEVREARKWKSSHEDIELLREKLLEEKGRRERAELEISKLSEAHVNAKKLEDELSSWESMMKEIPGVTSAAEIPLKFEALRKFVPTLLCNYCYLVCFSVI